MRTGRRKQIGSNAEPPLFSFFILHRILFERRQANDAIELLNLIGKNVTFEIHRNMGAEAEAAGCGGDPAAVWVRRAVQQDVQTSGTSGGRLEGGSGSSTTKL